MKKEYGNSFCMGAGLGLFTGLLSAAIALLFEAKYPFATMVPIVAVGVWFWLCVALHRAQRRHPELRPFAIWMAIGFTVVLFLTIILVMLSGSMPSSNPFSA